MGAVKRRDRLEVPIGGNIPPSRLTIPIGPRTAQVGCSGALGVIGYRTNLGA
jgi:hypothetical protein